MGLAAGADTPSRLHLGMKRTLCPNHPTHTHTYPHGLHFQGGHVGWVSMGKQLFREGNQELRPPAPHQPGGQARILQGRGGRRCILSRPGPILKDFQSVPASPDFLCWAPHEDLISFSCCPSAQDVGITTHFTAEEAEVQEAEEGESFTQLLQSVCSFH